MTHRPRGNAAPSRRHPAPWCLVLVALSSSACGDEPGPVAPPGAPGTGGVATGGAASLGGGPATGGASSGATGGGGAATGGVAQTGGAPATGGMPATGGTATCALIDPRVYCPDCMARTCCASMGACAADPACVALSACIFDYDCYLTGDTVSCAEIYCPEVAGALPLFDAWNACLAVSCYAGGC